MQSAVRLVHIHLDTSGSTTKCGAFLTYVRHALLHSSRMEFQPKQIYNGHIFIGFLPIEHDEGGRGVEEL